MTEKARDPGYELESLRGEIERVDRKIVQLISERVQLARRVGSVKRAAGLPTLDPAREAVIIRRSGHLARESALAEEDVREIFWHIVGLSRRAQIEPLSSNP